MSSIESAHIVSVFDAGTHESRPYLVMELLRGEDLGQRLRRNKRVPLGEAMHVAAQVLKGLARAHAAGVVHRDLKPDNVFLVKSDTDPLFAKIVDFGVSKIERPRNRTSPLALTGRGTVLGTPFYMCPEQAQAAADVDGRADLYSVGAILFECLSGRPPHTGETYEQIILSICMTDAPDLRAIDPSVSPAVASFIARALSRDRTQRFASAERMLAALHEVAPEEKTRVPLDPVAPDTLLSAGGVPTSGAEAVPTKPGDRGVQTRLVGALSDPALGAATIVTPPPSMDAPPEAARPAVSNESIGSLTFAGIPSKRRQNTTTIIVTAALAALTGVGVVVGVVTMLDKKPAVAAPQAALSSPSAASAPPSSPPTITSLARDEVPPPPASVPPAASSAPAAKAAGSAGKPVGPPTAGKPASTKLDISRDLP
jgi:serine/threonine-protein kinase